ncbi:C-factor [Amphibalanus amphitrite]|uniref:C-factor n=1 Tax=Amphibalanus amphitrite TaxID=1232801 RepID=A0A6A4WJQ2_AMPAM|nr:C-factor [Amphibalanus amphitrite]
MSSKGMQVAVVTGCSRGIGLAMVSELVKNNFKVFATCRNPASASQLSGLLTSLEQPAAVALDVTDEASIQAAYGTVKEAAGRVDLLINNAGISVKTHPVDPCETAQLSELNRLLETNVGGLVRVTQVFLPLLRASPRPRVVNISSLLGSIGVCKERGALAPDHFFSYRISKAAGNMATVAMSTAITEVEFLAVHPGWVATDMGNSGGRTADITVEESAEGVVREALRPQRRTGEFVDWRGNPVPW